MPELSLDNVADLISVANATREPSDALTRDAGKLAGDAESRLEDLFGVSCTLAVYGSLAPGRENHHVVAPLGGEWTEGVVEGDFAAEGWGATLGYPALRPRVGGAAVSVHVLNSPALAAAWPALDAFEGVEYRRILVPVFHSGRADQRALHTVANIYAAAGGNRRGIAR